MICTSEVAKSLLYGYNQASKRLVPLQQNHEPGPYWQKCLKYRKIQIVHNIYPIFPRKIVQKQI